MYEQNKCKNTWKKAGKRKQNFQNFLPNNQIINAHCIENVTMIGLVIQKECFFYFIWVVKVSLRLTLIQKGGLCLLRLLPLMRVLCLYPFRELLARGRFFEGPQNYMQNKNKRNENKIMLGGLNCTMDKIDREGKNKTQRLYRSCSNYTLSKFILDNGLEDLWRRENPDSPEFTCYDRSFAKDPG